MDFTLINNIIYDNDPFENTINTAVTQYKRLEEENKRLQNIINEYSKDSEIAKLRAEIERLREHSLIIFTENELAEEQDFINTHYNLHNCRDNKIAGNSWHYIITATGIGKVIEIECPICGERKNITDYECW